MNTCNIHIYTGIYVYPYYVSTLEVSINWGRGVLALEQRQGLYMYV